jgi:hypothetical protein
LITVVEADGFGILLTNDKNMASQQSLKGRRLAVVALPTSRRATIMSRVDDIIDTLERAAPGQHVVIDLDGSRTARSVGPDGRTAVEDWPRVLPFRW